MTDGTIPYSHQRERTIRGRLVALLAIYSHDQDAAKAYRAACRLIDDYPCEPILHLRAANLALAHFEPRAQINVVHHHINEMRAADLRGAVMTLGNSDADAAGVLVKYLVDSGQPTMAGMVLDFTAPWGANAAAELAIQQLRLREGHLFTRQARQKQRIGLERPAQPVPRPSGFKHGGYSPSPALARAMAL